ncbi:MAG: STAS domain-containing protein [Pseudomonadota bacterium]
MNRVQINLEGPRLNVSNCDQVKEEGLRLLANSDASEMIINMGNVEFIDSSGVGALVALRKAMGEDGIVTLINTHDFVDRVITLTNLSRVFQVRRAA